MNKEQIKLTATYLNNLAVACVGTYVGRESVFDRLTLNTA